MFVIIEKSKMNNIIGGLLNKVNDIEKVKATENSCEDKECHKGKIKIIIL